MVAVEDRSNSLLWIDVGVICHKVVSDSFQVDYGIPIVDLYW